jgi:CRISPR-associated protein Csb1
MTQTLTLDVVKQAVAGSAAAFRRVVELQPAGGEGDKVFPSTYEGGRYATEKRRINGEMVDCVLLDSVQSQANRMELALLEAWRQKAITMPMVVVDFRQTIAPEVGQITSLEAPHRIADAILRDSLLDGKRFRDSELGNRLNHVSNRNALALFELCPPALIFGMWDSTGPRGGLGAKFARAMTSEIIGIGAVPGVKTSSRIDPLQIMREAGPIYKTESGEWTLDKSQAVLDAKGKETLWGKEGKPSEINHGNVKPALAYLQERKKVITDKNGNPIPVGGFTIAKAIQTTVISLPAFRRLTFPIQNEQPTQVDIAARTVLAALGLCAATLASEQGYDLRSRCQLVPTAALAWELLGKPGDAPVSYTLTGKEAIEILKGAVAEAKDTGLPWGEEAIILKPENKLANLVKRSYELAAVQGAEEEGEE